MKIKQTIGDIGKIGFGMCLLASLVWACVAMTFMLWHSIKYNNWLGIIFFMFFLSLITFTIMSEFSSNDSSNSINKN